MRIISGKFKGQRFFPPKGFPSRPTTDFAKEALFNILENYLTLSGLEILDLFVGTGNITLEFASREAGRITSVDKDFKSVQHIRNLIRQFDLTGEVQVLKADVLKFIENPSKSYDLIFADPPYELPIHEELIEKIMTSDLLKESGVFILEHNTHKTFEEHPNFVQARKYGGVVFTFFEHNV